MSTVERLTMPRYSYADADYMARASRGTARRWISGYHYLAPSGERVEQPPVTQGLDRRGEISFLDLVEIVAIGQLKEHGFSLKTIRHIVQNCQEILEVPRPLATQKFKVGGREVFVDIGINLVEVGRRRGEQAWSEILAPFLETLDYTQGLASRWWPEGRDGVVVVDPSYGFGFPVIRNSGVRTEILLERFLAGDPPSEIAGDFNLRPPDVEQALRFEYLRAERSDVRWLEDEFPSNTPDTEWLPKVGAWGWLVISRDKKIRTRPAERHEILANGVGCFFLASKRNLPKAEMIALVRKTLPEMERIFASAPRPFIYTIDSRGQLRAYG